MSLVRATLSQVADEYLSDPNITSVGIGYKEVDGRPTDRLSLQFAVRQKMAPAALEAAATRAIPAQIAMNGITFDTDVVEAAGDDTVTAATGAGFDSDFLAGHRIGLPEAASDEVTADIALTKAGVYAWRDRRARKRDMRALWITRITAACRMRGTRYSLFINGLKNAGIMLNRKMLSQIAIEDPASFDQLVTAAKKAAVATPAKA